MEAVIDDRAYVATEDEGTAPVRGAQLPLAKYFSFILLKNDFTKCKVIFVYNKKSEQN